MKDLGFFTRLPSACLITRIVSNSRRLPVDFELVQSNIAFEELFEIGANAFMGERISGWLFQSERDKEKWMDEFRNVALENTSKEFRDTFQYGDAWYVVKAFLPFQDHLAILFHRATRYQVAHKTALSMKDSLIESRAQAQSIFENSPSAIIVFTVKGDGLSGEDYVIKDINPLGLKEEGKSKAHLIGKKIDDLSLGVDKPEMIKIFHNVWKTGQPTHGPIKSCPDARKCRWYQIHVFKLPSGEIVSMYEDVTEKKTAEEELLAEKERLRVTLHSIGDGVIATDEKGKVLIANNVAQRLIGWSLDEMCGKPLSSVFNIFNEITGVRCADPVARVFESRRIIGLANNTVLRAKDGSIIPIADSAAPITNHHGDILGVVLVFRDVTEARKKEIEIKRLSYTDSLTGLLNRAFFESHIFEMCKRTQGVYPITLVMGDLDGLKLINDAYGHEKGDEALIKVANIIRKCCADKGICARWGGDEFALLLPKTDEQMVERLCSRIKQDCGTTKVTDTGLSISLGYAVKKDKYTPWRDVFKKAEDNMYRSKLLNAKSYRSTILTSIKNTLFEKSFETKEHGERIGLFCREIGKVMGFGPRRLDDLEVLAMLHDIGKIAIDERILQKTGNLTDSEMAQIKKHPEIGYRIASAVPELANIAELILSHHERWDGNGYPRGLAGEEIPLLSRILAVADAYDVITQGRPYQKARSSLQAQEELRANSGEQFDPEIVDIFLSCLKDCTIPSTHIPST